MKGDYNIIIDCVKKLNYGSMSCYLGGASSVTICHDVDIDIEAALNLACIEKKNGISAIYFILHTADYYKSAFLDGYIKEFLQLGHDIGFHNNLLANWIRNKEKPIDALRDFMDRANTMGKPILFTVAHGDHLCHEKHFLNEYVWTHAPMNPKFSNYLSIDGMAIEKLNISDYFLYDCNRMQYDICISDIQQSIYDTINKIKLIDTGQRTYLSIHPEYWD